MSAPGRLRSLPLWVVLLTAAMAAGASTGCEPRRDTFYFVPVDTLRGVAGSTVTAPIALDDISDSEGRVELSIAPVTDLTPTVAPSTLTQQAPNATLSVAIAPGASPGVRTLILNGELKGLDDDVSRQQLITVQVLPTPAFEVSVTPSSLGIVRDGTAQAALAVTRTGGFTGAIGATVAGLPQGVSVATGAPGTGSTGTLSFTATAAAPLGTFPLVITLTGGSVTRTASLALTVSEPPGFTVTSQTASQLVVQGATGAPVGVTVARQGGFTGAVTLSVTGLPDSVRATVTQPGTGTSGSVAFAVAPSAVPGTYSLSLRATATGAAERTLPFSLIVGVAGSYLLAPSPTAVSAVRGGAGVPVAVAVLRQGGFSGAVTLAVSGLPTDVSASITQPGAGDAGSVLLTAGPSAPIATSTVTITGSAQGLGAQSTAVSLTVTAPPGLLLSAATTLDVTRNGSASTLVQIARTGGWTGAVSFQVTGAPDGMTAAMSPASTTGNSSTLDVAVGPSVPLGSYALQIRGTGANGATGTATVTVRVLP